MDINMEDTLLHNFQ